MSQVRYCIRKYKKWDISDDILCNSNSTKDKSETFKVLNEDDIDFEKQTLAENPIQSAHDIQMKLASTRTHISRSTTRNAIRAAGFTN